MTDCIPCDSGQYCSTVANSAPDNPCDAGYFCTTKASVSNPNPDPNAAGGAISGQCTVGNYCPAASAVEIPCEPGKACTTVALAIADADCTAGYYCQSGATTATPTNLATEGGDQCHADIISAKQAAYFALYALLEFII